MNKPGASLVSNAAIFGLGSLLACMFALLAKNSVLVDGAFLPFGIDAFYHARRILDAAAGSGLRQFDAFMHVPEGSWVPWPWAFDWLWSVIIRIAAWLSPGTDPMQILVYVPVAWLVVNVGLLLGIFSALGIRLEFKALGVAGFALLPLTQRLHGIGVIDHHFMELTFVMLVTLLVLRWMMKPASTALAVACGAALGLAQAFHHGLFILQLPALGVLFVLWLRGLLPPDRAVRLMATTLLLSTALLILPSGAFRDGQFAMATFSWFHLYVTLCTTVALLFMSFRAFALRLLVIMGVAGVVLALPLASEILLGTRFVTGQLEMLGQILEMASPFAMIAGRWGFGATLGLYSGLLLLAPVLLLAGVYLMLSEKQALPIAFGVFSFFGLGLLLLQYRLNYFGLCFLLAGPFYFIERFSPADKPKRAAVFLGTLVLFALAYRPPLGGPLFRVVPTAGDHLYESTQALYPALESACASAPGTVAAASQFGHYIRFHTDCSVISNNFLLTEQHFRKVRESDALFHLSVEELRSQAPDVRYVFAYLANVYEQRGNRVYLRNMDDIRGRNPALINELMLSRSRSADVEIIREVFVDPDAATRIPLAGVYRIRP